MAVKQREVMKYLTRASVPINRVRFNDETEWERAAYTLPIFQAPHVLLTLAYDI